MTSTRTLPLHFSGPLTFGPGEHSLFTHPSRNSSCVYLWTCWSDRHRIHFIHYVGEAERFAARQREHLVNVLGVNYGIWDVAAAREGISKITWNGMWRDKSTDAPARTIAEYAALSASVITYVQYVTVLVAPVEADSRVRKHIEGSIAHHVRNAPGDVSRFYPSDNRTAPRRESMDIRLAITSEVPIAGLPTELLV